MFGNLFNRFDQSSSDGDHFDPEADPNFNHYIDEILEQMPPELRAIPNARQQVARTSLLGAVIMTIIEGDAEAEAIFDAEDSFGGSVTALRDLFERRIATDPTSPTATDRRYASFMCVAYGMAMKMDMVKDEHYNPEDFHHPVTHKHLDGVTAYANRQRRQRIGVREVYVRVQADGRLTTLDNQPFKLMIEAAPDKFDEVIRYHGDDFGTGAPLYANTAWVIERDGKLFTPEGEDFLMFVSTDDGKTYEAMQTLAGVQVKHLMGGFMTGDGLVSEGDAPKVLREFLQGVMRQFSALSRDDGSLDPALRTELLDMAARGKVSWKAEVDGTGVYVLNLATGKRYRATPDGIALL